MMTINNIQKLYLKDKLSAMEISSRLSISKWSVLSFMRRHNIKRRTSAESNNIRFLRTQLSYKKKNRLSNKEKSLYLAAIMLYWAEGAKKEKFTLDFANSDQNMVLIFLTALRKIYNIDENKLRVFLYCYSNQNIQKIINYWSDILKISKPQFTKPYVRKDYDPNKTNRMPYGLVHIRYSDKRLLMQFKKEIGIMQTSLMF